MVTIFFVIIGIILIFDTSTAMATYLIEIYDHMKIGTGEEDSLSRRQKVILEAGKVQYLSLILFGCVVLGTAFFMLNERYTFVEALYFVVETITVTCASLTSRFRIKYSAICRLLVTAILPLLTRRLSM